MEELKKAPAAKVARSGAAPGAHNVVFVGAYDLPPRTDGGANYGPAVLLKWRADDGQEPSAIVSAVPTAKNACGRLLAGMVGRPLRPDEVVPWEGFEGQRFVVIVVTNAAGNGTKVSEVTRV